MMGKLVIQCIQLRNSASRHWRINHRIRDANNFMQTLSFSDNFTARSCDFQNIPA